MTEGVRDIKKHFFALLRPFIEASYPGECGHCRAPVLIGFYCSETCDGLAKLALAERKGFEEQIAVLKMAIEKLKDETHLTTLLKKIDLLSKENAALVDENLVLTKGLDRVKSLDNPAMRWVHRALKRASEIRKKR